MSIIKLDDNVACQLKSHEYVLSLTSVVRELIQNSADAGASKIIVEVDSEKFDVTVHDNGHGISPSDLNKLGTNHMTSKLQSIKGLDCLQTFGFRGEALYMIGRCSKLKVTTHPREYNGVWSRELPAQAYLECESSLPSVLKEGFGTIVKASDLFYNFPVRRKMLLKRSKGSITSSLRDQIFSLLISFPFLRVELRLDDKLLVKSSNITEELTFQSKLCLAFQNIFGNVVLPERFKYVSTYFKSFAVRGIVSTYPVQTKDYQYIYINGRKYLDSKFINSLDRIFQNTKYIEREWNSYNVKTIGNPYNNHPVFVISCACPPSVSDTLQDSSKDIMKSEHFNILQPLIKNVVTSFLKHLGYEVTIPDVRATQQSGFRESVTFSKEIPCQNSTGRVNKGLISGKVTSNSSKILDILHKPVINKSILLKIEEKMKPCCKSRKMDSEFDIKTLDLLGNESVYLKTHQIRDFKLLKSDIKEFHVIKQVDKKFILVKCKDMLLILDQHACHERVRVEVLLKELILSVLNGAVEICDVDPIVFCISQEEATWFKEYQDEFNAWGVHFRLHEGNIANTSVKITSLPSILQEKIKKDADFLRNTLLQHLYEMKSHRPKIASFLTHKQPTAKWWTVIPSIPRVLIEIMNSKACRSAIMFGDELSLSECEILISDLSKCQLPFYCAHGRPSIVPVADLTDHVLPLRFADYEIN